MNGSLFAIVPMACIVVAGVAAMLAEAFRDPGEQLPIGPLGAIGLVGAAVSALRLWNLNATSFGVVAADNFGLFATLVLVGIGLLSLAISAPVIDREGLPRGEYYALMLFSLAGMVLMAMATDLIVIFLALEVLSLALYALTGIRRESAAGGEAALKYFMLGAFSSAFFLYGIALVYGLAGSTRLDQIGTLLASQAMAPTPLQLVALGLLLVGFAFKVSAVPFHMWAPDAYEAAPSSVTAFMSSGVKVAAFAAFARVFLAAVEPLAPAWVPVIWTLAALTMVLGTVAGVTQANVKRMLAYSSIAHAGYLLVAIVSTNETGKGALLFYLPAYALATIGAFGVIGLVGTADGRGDRVDDFAGLGARQPVLAALMTIFLLSLGGFPPFGGFIAKWYVFTAAVEAGHARLAVIGVLTSVVSVFFYLRVVVMMYMTPGEKDARGAAVPVIAGLALVVSAALVVYLGVLPARVLEWAAASVGTIF